LLSVLHVCTDFWPSTGGIQQFVRELATRSATVDLRSTVLCFNRVKGITAKLPATDRLDGVVLHRIPFLNLKYYKPVAIPLSLIRAHDLVHVHGIGAPLDYIAVTKGIHRRPFVVSTHGGIFHTSALARFKQLYFRTVVRWALGRADFVAADSASDASLFAMVSQRVQLLENAIDVGPLLALPVDRKRPGSFLYVGRLSDNKGIPLLLNAVAMALKRGASLSLRIVGPDVEGKREGYEALARRLGVVGQVDFVGEVDKRGLLEEFSRAETFVSASQYEGFGLSAVEAKAAGCRLLLHRNDAFESLFGACLTAILVDFRDPNAAGAAMIEIMRQRVVDATQDSVRRETEAYSWERKLSEWAAVYRSVCSVESRP
jgi:alpha-1,3-mannosyltransferase